MMQYFRNKTIVLKRLEKEKKKLQVLFYIISGKLRQKNSDFKGKIEFYEENDKLKPYKMWIDRNNRPEYLDLRHFKDYFRAAKNIIIPPDSKPSFYDKLLDMFSNMQIKNVEEVSLCRYCLLKEKFTILEKNNTVASFYGEPICIDCAVDELMLELRYSGMSVPDALRSHITRILSHKRDLQAIYQMLQGNIDIIRDSKYTLYDIIEKTKHIEKIKVDDLPISPKLKSILKKYNITTLTEIQVEAVKSGLFEGYNLLVVSATSSGKTLVGELAGVNKALNGKPLVFLVPLVALANQKYDEFSKKYKKLGLKVAIRVGMSRLDVGTDELVIMDMDISDADIIVGTYEAFDFILRSGAYKKLRDIGTIVIDEIQMLCDEDRGIELDGVISRISKIYPNAQKIFLSATVGNAKDLAKQLNAKLVEYEGRPVPLERHLILAKDEYQKIRFLQQLIKHEYNQISKYGFRGQTIVFTYSRRRTSEIANALKSRGLKVAAYHAGLTYARRRLIEIGFEKGDYQAVITTAALGAGVDFPASQVIFFDLAMGKDWLTAAEFVQYCGRAGRLGKHDRGKVVLLIIPGNKFHSGQTETEDEVAIKLLSGKIEPVEIPVDFEKIEEQILANISTLNECEIEDIENMLLSSKIANLDTKTIVTNLKKDNFVKTKEKEHVIITELGLATSVSFLTPRKAKTVIKKLKTNEDPLIIAISIEPFDAVYLSSKVHEELVRSFRFQVSSKLFSGSVLDLMIRKGSTRRLPNWIFNVFAKWAQTFFTCNCPERPYCEHGILNFSKYIVDLRVAGNNPSQISNIIARNFELQVYPGDIFHWLDSLVHHIEGVTRIAKVLQLAETYIKLVELKRKIERPTRGLKNVQKTTNTTHTKQKR